MSEFVTRDSGVKAEYESGMRRDARAGKPHMELLIPEGVPFEEQMLVRLGHLYARGEEKYGSRNWEKACTEKELGHLYGSLLDHVWHTIIGTQDGEDHAAAVLFNLIAVENTRRNIRKAAEPEEPKIDRTLPYKPRGISYWDMQYREWIRDAAGLWWTENLDGSWQRYVPAKEATNGP
jgi:hypothetical protein